VLSRRQLLAAAVGSAVTAPAQQDDGPRRVILDASRALQAGNAARFMGYFDEERFQASSELRRSVSALLETRTVASSVDVVSMADAPDGKTAQVDWLLQLTPLAGPGLVETRRQTLDLTLEQQARGAWRITSLAPIEFFTVL
jgi:hypothetical protein